MKRKNFRYLLCLLAFYSLNAYGQSCAENLEKARQHYREGQLYLVYDLLDECLKQKELTSEKMVDGYRLLANTSFLLDSIVRGEEYLKNILNKNLSFQADETDVFKLREGLPKIRKSPKFQFGLSVGFNQPGVILDDVYDAIFERNNAQMINGLTQESLLTDFDEQIGPNMSIVFVKRLLNEFDLETSILKKIFNKIDLETGVGYQATKYNYFDEFSNENKETKVIDIQVPLLINYRLPILISKRTLAVQTGVNFSWLNSWKHSDKLGEKLNTDTKDIRSSLNYSWVVGAFVNLKVGKVVLRPGFQYWFGLTPRSQKISDSENAALVYNDPSFINYNARFNYFNFSIGILKQRF